jgi:hypothetical protein
MKLRVLIAALMLSTAAHAMDIYRFGSSTVSVGDSVAKLIDVAGEPIYKEPIEAKQGGYAGERWQYKQGSTTIQFTISGGRIVSISESH